MKTLQVLTVLAASAILSTGAFAGNSSGGSSTTVITAPVVQVFASEAVAHAKSATNAFGSGSVFQVDATSTTPYASSASVQASAIGAFGASVKGRANSTLTTNQLLIVGY